MTIIFRCVMLLTLFASSLASADVQVLMKTNLGNITLALDEENAPVTVANFLAYVDDDAYDETIFHRVIAGFMVQGGGLTIDLSDTPDKGTISN